MICGKITYRSRIAAVESIAGIKKDKRASQSKKKPVRPYYCNDCGGWHLTSNKIRHKPRRSITKELHTTEIKQVRRLKIIDHTSDRFSKTMGRLCVLLFALLIVAGTAAGFSDSRADKAQTTQVKVMLHAHHYFSSDVRKATAFDADLSEELVLTIPRHGNPKPVDVLSNAKATEGYFTEERGPPDSLSPKIRSKLSKSS